MRPLISQFIDYVNISKGVEDPTHQARLSHRSLRGIKPRRHHAFGTHHAGHRTCELAKKVVRPGDGFLSGGDRVSDLLRLVHSRVDDRHANHPDAVLDARGQHGHLGKDPLISRASHYLVLVSFGATVRANDDDGGAEILDKMPASTGDCENVRIGVDVAKDFQRGVVLEE